MIKPDSGTISLKGENITNASIRKRNDMGLSHIPEDRHKYGLLPDYNLALKSYHHNAFQSGGFIKFKVISLRELISRISKKHQKSSDAEAVAAKKGE